MIHGVAKHGSKRRIICSIAKMREQKGMTQAELAERAGIKPNTLSEIENGIKLTSLTTALRIAEALECSVSDIFMLEPRLNE